MNTITITLLFLFFIVFLFAIVGIIYIIHSQQAIKNQTINDSQKNNQQTINNTLSENSQTNDNFEQSILQLHNNFRENHRVEPLVWDATLAEQSKKWADYICKNDCEGSQIAHSNYPTITMKLGDSKYGENVSWNMNSNGINNVVAVNSAVNGWYNEYSCYDYNDPKFSSNSGHFTQVVWKDTKKIGCARSLSSDKTKEMIVCQYSPSGNIDTNKNYTTNVLPCLKNCPQNKCQN